MSTLNTLHALSHCPRAACKVDLATRSFGGEGEVIPLPDTGLKNKTRIPVVTATTTVSMKFVGDNWSCQIMRYTTAPLCPRYIILYTLFLYIFIYVFVCVRARTRVSVCVCTLQSVYHLIYYRVTYNPVNVCFNSTPSSRRRRILLAVPLRELSSVAVEVHSRRRTDIISTRFE